MYCEEQASKRFQCLTVFASSLVCSSIAISEKLEGCRLIASVLQTKPLALPNVYLFSFSLKSEHRLEFTISARSISRQSPCFTCNRLFQKVIGHRLQDIMGSLV
ncbi:hypothetical protein RRG08_036054 [Elysia crispata]|uniref:Uncharacterized protein n=1 Tax=Elysia crispata TaxID=231223 RepID=A0AAE1AM77_9GAST|nr:hypothetical protein RRG08_036054 [Elysia crispata]